MFVVEAARPGPAHSSSSTMFPTFDVPPQHAETVGARKARKAKEEETARRASTSTSQSSGSGRSVKGGNSNRPPLPPTTSSGSSVSSGATSKTASRGFGSLFKNRSRGVQEISELPTLKKPAAPTQAPTAESELEQPERDLETEPEPEPEQEIDPDLPSPVLEIEQSIPRSIASTAPPHRRSDPYHDALRREQQQQYRHQSYDELPPPPSRNLPSLPPSGALPQPPSPGLPPPRSRARIDQTTSRRFQVVDRTRSQYSTTSSQLSYGTTTSSERTAFSNKSVFSTPSHCDDVLSEESDVGEGNSPPPPSVAASSIPPSAFIDSSHPHAGKPPRHNTHTPPARPPTELRHQYGSNIQLEPVTETRSSSRLGGGEGPAKAAAQSPFARALAKMESASARIISARLSEEWEGLEDDDSYQEVVFEKRLWALTAYQRLTQNKHLQSPAHEILAGSRLADGRRILHLHGSLADGWMLATRYPAATVYTLSSMNSSNLPTSYPAPLNHHSLYVPSISSSMPFPDSYFDAVISRSCTTSLRNEEWAQNFFDCMRVLKPGGQIEILSLDPHMSREGHRLSSWVDEHVASRLEAHAMSMLPSDTVLDTMEIVGLQNIRRARIALPAHLPTPKAVGANMAKSAPPGTAVGTGPGASGGASAPAPSTTPQDILDASKMMAFLGRHLYQELYGKFVHTNQGEEWFWTRKDIRAESEKHQTKMVLTIACAQKQNGPVNGESYLDI